MIPLSLAQIAGITGATLDRVPDPRALVRGPVVIDSREAAPGGLFAALPGERADGHDFAAAAVAAGAVAVLASRQAGVPALIVPDVQAALAPLARAVVDRLPGLTIAGITGSSGKTTTKDLLAQLAGRLGPTVAPAARSTTSSATRLPCCAPASGPGTWSWSSAPAAAGTSRGSARSRRRGSAPC